MTQSVPYHASIAVETHSDIVIREFGNERKTNAGIGSIPSSVEFTVRNHLYLSCRNQAFMTGFRLLPKSSVGYVF